MFGGNLLFSVLALTLIGWVYSQVQSSDVNSKDMFDLQIDMLRKIVNNNSNARPVLADAWRKLGILLQSKDIRYHQGGGHLQPEALKAFNNALELDDGETDSLIIQVNYLKGILLKMMGFGPESLDALDRALEMPLSRSDKSSILFHKGEAFMMMGQIQNASLSYLKALKLSPCRIERYYAYVLTSKENKSLLKSDWEKILNDIRTAMKNCTSPLFNQQSSNEVVVDVDDYDFNTGNNLQSFLQFGDEPTTDTYRESSEVYWALFLAAEKAERYSLAWWYLDQANAFEKNRRELKFQKSDALQQTAQIHQVFHKGFWDTLPLNKEDSSTVPIFIVGMMRSGSTLLETMLDSHMNIWGMGEDSIFNGNLTYFRNKLVSASMDNKGMKAYKELERVIEEYGESTVAKMKKLAKTKVDRNKAKKIKHIVDKMLFNYRNIGFIHIAYPNALILHTIRDPLDTLFSCYRNKFDDYGLEWSLDIEDLILQYVLYLEIMNHWRQVLPGRIIDIRYELLVTEPEATLRNIIVNKLKLKWDPNVMQFHSSNRSVHTHSQSQVRQNIYQHSIGSWRRYADQLTNMKNELLRYLPKLKENQALPYMDEMNWELDEHFDYSTKKTHCNVKSDNTCEQ